MTNIDKMGRALKNFEFLALQFPAFFDNKSTTVTSKKFYIRQLIWSYNLVFSFLFEKYFFSFSKENEKISSQKLSNLRFDDKMKSNEFSMEKFNSFYDEILIIQNFWITVKTSLFTTKFQELIVYKSVDQNVGLSDKLNLLLFEKEPLFHDQPNGISLFQKEIGDLFIAVNKQLVEIKKLYFLRKKFVKNFFELKTNLNTEIQYLCFLMSLDQEILLTISDFVTFYENFDLLVLRFKSYFYQDKFQPVLEEISNDLLKIKYALDYFDSKNE